MNPHPAEEISQALFEEAGDALFLFDPESEQIVDANPMAQRLSGFPRSELLRLKATYLFRSETPGGLNRLRHAYRKTGIFHSQEGFLLRTQRDGAWVPVNLTITRLHVQPRTLGLITVRDVSEQREAHVRLQRMDTEMRRVLASVSDCLWSAEIDARGQWTYKYISPVIEKIAGQPPEFFQSGTERWRSAVHPEDRPRWEAALHRLRAGQSSREEYRVLRPDGNLCWVRDSVMASRTADGPGWKLDGVVTDITEQKRSEALVEAQNRVLEMIATGASLPHILDVLVRAVQGQAPSLVGAILLLEGSRLRTAAGPDMPTELREALEAVDADQAGSCGRAVALRRPVVSTDIVADPLWADLREPALLHGIRACAATPVLAKNGEVLGVFAACYRQPRLPSVREQGLIDLSNRLAAIAIERKRAEEALRASEERQSRIVETIADGILLIDRDGRIRQANAAAEKLFGLPRAEIVRRTYDDPAWKITTADGRPIGENEYAVARVLLTGQPVHGVERAIWRPGSSRVVVLISAAPLRDSTGTLIGVIESLSDITERRMAEEAIRRSEERFRVLVEKSADAITLLGGDRRIVYASSPVTHMLGHSLDQFVGRDLIDFIHPEDQSVLQLFFLECVAEPGSEVHTECRVQHRSGEWRTVEATWVNRLEDPAVGAIVLNYRDITERRRAEQQMRFQANVLAQVTDAILVLDRNERITYWNKGAERLYGFSAMEVMGRLLAEVIHYRWVRPSDEEDAKQTLQASGVWQGENAAFRKSGEKIFVESTVTLLKDGSGNPVGTLAVVHDVTERKRADLAVRQAEAKFRSIFENAVEGIYQTTLEGRFVTANTMLARIYGFDSPRDLMANASQYPNHFYVDPDRRAEFVRQVQESGTMTGFESQIRRRDGRLVWIMENARVQRDGSGRVAGFEGTVVDITERKEAEESLRETNERLRALIQASPLAILALDPAGNVRSWNAAATRMFGWAEAEVLGKPSPLVPSHRRPDTRTLRERVLRGESFAGVEAQRWRKDGSLIDVSISAAPLYDAQGKVAGVMAVLADVTDRKAAETALARERAILRSLIDSIPDLIFYKDQTGAFLGCNTAFEQFIGRTGKDLAGLTDRDLFPGEAAAGFQERDRLVLTEGKPRRNEEWLNYPDGRQVLVETLKTPFFGPDGRSLGLIGISRDITERKRLEEQLRQAQKMEAVGQLAGGVAHDFNNLLTAILGNIGLLGAALPADGPHHEMIQSTEKAAQRAAELTRQLLGFSRRTMLRLEVVNLNAAIQEIMGILRRTIDPRIGVEIHHSRALWNVQADPGQINQVLMNLCLNARDAMRDGGVLRLETANVVLDEEYARLHLEARTGEFVRLRVSDTGHGITADIRPRIFEPFFTTKQPGQGTGLGLAMVFGIVTQHQGWIECTSEVDRGTRFDIYLPRFRTSDPAVPTAAVAPAPAGGTETILLVDDEPMIRNLGRTILQRYGYEVLLAEDGQQAVEIYQRSTQRIDLVILDLTMPRLSGRDTLRQLSQFDPNVHVVFASGYSAEHITESEKDGVLGFISKPYRPQELAARVRTALNKCKEYTTR